MIVMLKKYIQKKIGLPLICLTLSYLCVSCSLTSKTDTPAILVDLTIEGDFKKAIIAVNTATDNTSNRENLGLLPSEPETTNLSIHPLNYQMVNKPLLTPSKSSLDPKTPLLRINKLEENPDVIEFYDPYQEKNIHATKLQENASCIVLGIGVAVRVSTSTSSFSCFSFSFWLTPKRCSSSIISSPRL